MFRTDLVSPISPMRLFMENNSTVEQVTQSSQGGLISLTIGIVIIVVVTFFVYKK